MGQCDPAGHGLTRWPPACPDDAPASNDWQMLVRHVPPSRRDEGSPKRLPCPVADRCRRWPAGAPLSIWRGSASRSCPRAGWPRSSARNARRRTDAAAARADDVEGRRDHSSGRSNRPRPTGRWPRSARVPPRLVHPRSGSVEQQIQLRMSLALPQRPCQPPCGARPDGVTSQCAAQRRP
jgi:hypothetical protein